MGRARALLMAGAAALTLAGCSLALEKLKAHCETHEECHALNVAHGLDDGPDGECEIYQCRKDKAGCERRARDLDGDGYLDSKTCEGRPTAQDCNDDAGTTNPDGGELCNGADDNCNGVIDEGVLSEKPARSTQITLETAKITSLSYAREPDGSLLLALTSNDEAADRASTLLLHADDALMAAQSGMPSRWLGSAQENCTADCKWWEVAVAASENYLFGAAISGQGCRAGQLRLGLGKISDPTSITWDGRCAACGVVTDDSNVSAGVDVLASSPSCSTSGEQRGASAPSLAVLSDDKGQPREGLALWRAGPGPATPMQPLPLVGLSLDLVPSAFEPRPVIGLQARARHSASLHVEPSPGLEPAVIQASRAGVQGGYFVAYDSQRGVELAFLPADAASVADAVPLTIARAGVTHVALAERGEAADGGSELALAFRSTGPQGDRLTLAKVRFDARPKPALTLASCAVLREAPDLREGSLVPVGTGFAERSGVPGGGLFVSWIERVGELDRLMAARVPEQWTASSACSQSIEDQLLEPPFGLAESPTIAHAFTFSDAEGTPSYGLISGRDLNLGALRCQR